MSESVSALDKKLKKIVGVSCEPHCRYQGVSFFFFSIHVVGPWQEKAKHKHKHKHVIDFLISDPRKVYCWTQRLWN